MISDHWSYFPNSPSMHFFFNLFSLSISQPSGWYFSSWYTIQTNPLCYVSSRVCCFCSPTCTFILDSIQLMFFLTSFRSRGPRFISFFSHLAIFIPPLWLASRPFFDPSLLPLYPFTSLLTPVGFSYCHILYYYCTRLTLNTRKFFTVY